MNNEIDGTYTRLLRHIQNVHWKQHITNKELYGHLRKASELVQSRRLKLAGHCWRSGEVASDLVMWKPTNGHRNQGKPRLNFTSLLNKDIGLSTEDLKTAMSDRNLWRTYILDSGVPD